MKMLKIDWKDRIVGILKKKEVLLWANYEKN